MMSEQSPERFAAGERATENFTDDEIEALRQEAAEWWAQPEVVAESDRIRKLAEAGIRGTAADPNALWKLIKH